MATRYIVGDPVNLGNTFTVGGVNTDPTTVTLAVTEPDGTTTTYDYAAAEITRTAAGIYTKTITTDAAGGWTYKWTGTGTAADVADGTFRVFDAADGQLYAPLELVKSHMNIGDTADDVHLQVSVNAAKTAIEEFCGRRFYRATQTRYYDPPGACRLWIDDLVSVTSVKTDDGNDDTYENTWSTSDYLLGPHNAATDGKPYRWIETRSGGSYSWPAYRKSIQIVGTFGWPSIPAAVEQAAVLQAARFFKRATEAAFGIAMPSLDGPGMRLLSRLDADVELLLQPYRVPVVA